MDTKIIAILGKGGCGKTTSASYLAKSLTDMGRNVLVIDLDSQAANLSSMLGIDSGEGIAEVIRNERSVADVAVQVSGYDAVSTGDGLRLIDPYDYNNDELVIRSVVEGLGYDYVLVDCPPSTDSVQSSIAIASADVALVCVGPTKEETKMIAEVAYADQTLIDEIGSAETAIIFIVNKVPRLGETLLSAINTRPTAEYAFPQNAPTAIVEKMEILRARAGFVAAVPYRIGEDARKIIGVFYAQAASFIDARVNSNVPPN